MFFYFYFLMLIKIFYQHNNLFLHIDVNNISNILKCDIKFLKGGIRKVHDQRAATIFLTRL